MPCVVVDPSAAVPPALQSASSSDTTWDTTYQDEGPARSANGDMNWDSPEDELTVPKLEPMDDDCFRMDDVKEEPRASVPLSDCPSAAPPKVKRPRGRPRKHPIGTQQVSSKIAKGRSKTGCITCRRRKKKCDEAKPRCLNCEKNAVICEGYHEKTIWRGGREKKTGEDERRQSLPQITLQPIFEGVETAEDRIFFGHFINNLSGVLTVEGQHRNAFKDMLLQMALEHRGLMHSILSLASKHLDYETPYGSKLLSSNPKVNRSSMIARSHFHHDQAMQLLLQWGKSGEEVPDQKANLAPYYGQMLCLLLQAAAEGSTVSAHRVHLRAYKSLIQENPPPDEAFTTFITELFQYRVFADELILQPDMQSKRLATEDWEPWTVIEPARLIGIGDRLFHYLAKITTIKNEIRSNLSANTNPIVTSEMAMRAHDISAGIMEWEPTWPAGDNRNRVSQLYKQMMWVYLYRTIFPPPASAIANTMNNNMGVDSSVSPYVAISNVADGSNVMPLSPASSQSCSTTRSPPPVGVFPPGSDRRLSNGSFQSTPIYLVGGGSPPPIMLFPPHSDPRRLSLAVDECLGILEEFKPSDPVQTLLLVPCLVLGCASFKPEQQDRVRDAIRIVRGYTGMRNCDRLAEFLEIIWELMGRGEWEKVWDWQRTAKLNKLDFACA
ncbi:fungal-specific transcription factor domain-containing protein [Xylaria bambusicola]|uniref:fungal-specific transcription factor domain-containing protein n=1 Tax=Xylaria bambusicola TaxID=326684 RepID=UPI0020082057|nr:fungal-specific transcription factor domain-containing protein [Xylaria bambusicola]KAI0508805.1 fungal-specific transcription factor domain-containing protein [Xylaria bambusicola]